MQHLLIVYTSQAWPLYFGPFGSVVEARNYARKFYRGARFDTAVLNDPAKKS